MASHSADEALAQALSSLTLAPPLPQRSTRRPHPTIPLLSLTRPTITLTLTPPSPTSTTPATQYPVNQPPASPNFLAPPTPGSRKRQRSASSSTSSSSSSSPSSPASPTLPANKRRRLLFGEITSSTHFLPSACQPSRSRSHPPPRASQSSPPRLRRRPARLPLSGPAHPQLSVSGGLASGLPVHGRQPGAEERRGAGEEKGARDERR